jgi:hypothetical protein
MRTVYAIQFTVLPEPAESVADCVSRLRDTVAAWIRRKYETVWSTQVELDGASVQLEPRPQHALSLTEEAAGESSLTTVDWRHPHEDRDPAKSDDKLQWHTQVIVARNESSVQLQIVVRILSLEFVVKPVAFSVGRPAVVESLLTRFRCTHDGTEIPTSVRDLAADEVEVFVEDVLLNPFRRLPVLVLTPDMYSEIYSVEAQELLQSVLGYAAVATLRDKWAAFKLTECVGKSLSCYDGAVRLYWPRFSLDADPFQHPLYLKPQIRFHASNGRPLSRHLFRFFSAISVFRLAEGNVIRAVRTNMAAARTAELELARKNLREGSLDPKEREAALEAAWRNNDELNERIKTILAENDTLKQELSDQKALWTEYGGYIAPDATEEARAEEGPAFFDSVVDAMQTASKDFSEQLLFLDSAKKSASNSPYGNPARVYECLEALAQVCMEWQQNNGQLGRGWKAALTELGFGSDYKAEISQTARGKWGDEYRFQYLGEKRPFEEHITLGAKQADKCMSIHWYRDDTTRKLVVGWCGRHLTNTRS